MNAIEKLRAIEAAYPKDKWRDEWDVADNVYDECAPAGSLRLTFGDLREIVHGWEVAESALHAGYESYLPNSSGETWLMDSGRKIGGGPTLLAALLDAERKGAL